MTVDSLEKYKKLLNKEQRDKDEYVIIDAKWFTQWKQYVKIEPTEDDVQPPGEIDFTNLVDPATVDHSDGVQLKPSAVEGNDYTFIPIDLFTELKASYGQKGTEIVRRVIPTKTNGDEFVIETFFVPLRVCTNTYTTISPKQIYRSRRTPLEMLKRDICNMIDISSSGKHIYVATDDRGDFWELLQADSNAVLDDVNIIKNAYITCDTKTTSVVPYGSQVSGSSYDRYPKSGRYTPGLCGLSNLGNTCFMNSALQCLSNVPILTQYFQNKEYKNDINKDNPLGMGGDVAKAYGELVEHMWSGDNDYYAPKTLKNSVARYAPQFSGYNQQDSQEFMSFLLDGLHEDLNRVKKKPYVEKKDDDGQISDKELAKLHWDYYLARNQSKIQEIFHGQIRSQVDCLTCRKSARTFDPFCFLSLPLPDKKKSRRYRIEYVTLDGRILTYSVKTNENGQIRDLVKDFCKMFRKDESEPMETDPNNPFSETDDDVEEPIKQDDEDLYKNPPNPEYIAATEVYNYRIHTLYRDESSLYHILERDRVVFYQTKYSLKKEGDENILMPCTFRTTGYYKSSFGLPFYIALPRKNCKGKDVQVALESMIDKFLPLSQVKSTDKDLYTPMLSYNDYGNSVPKLLSSVLDEHINFVTKNVSLQIEVDEAVVAKYDELEKARTSKSQKYDKYGNEKKDQRPVSLNDCLKYFTAKEILSDDDLWFCPTCKELKKVTKKMDLWRLPETLIIQLKRFNYTRYWRDKIDVVVDFPITGLDLSQYVINADEKQNAIYDLISISNHMGGLGGGHYTAYGKNARDNKWHLFDDGYVSAADNDRLVGKSAYVLIYQRRSPMNSATRPGSSRKTNNP